MSLATRQLLLQAQSDRTDLLRRISVGEDPARLKQLLAGTTKRMDTLQKTLEAEIAQAKQKAAAGPKVKQNQLEVPRSSGAEDVYLPCSDCSNTFVWSGKDQAFFKKQGWETPVRCPECRESKKQRKAPAGKTLSCCDCKAEFFFSDDKQRLFEEKGYAEPKRCGPCASHQKALAPITITCAICSKGSTFSVKAQRDFKARGWEQPKICVTCRIAKKAEEAAAAAAAAAAPSETEAPETPAT